MENLVDTELTIKIKISNQDITIYIYNPPGHNIDDKSYNYLANRSNVIIPGDFDVHLPLYGGRKLTLKDS